MKRLHRHPSRDNAGPGYWFLTIKTHGDHALFGDVINGRMHLNELGRIVRDCWRDVPLHFPHVARDAWIVMPNHFHSLLHLLSCDFAMDHRLDRVERFGKPVKGSVATVVRSFKSAATRAIASVSAGLCWFGSQAIGTSASSVSWSYATSASTSPTIQRSGNNPPFVLLQIRQRRDAARRVQRLHGIAVHLGRFAESTGTDPTNWQSIGRLRLRRPRSLPRAPPTPACPSCPR